MITLPLLIYDLSHSAFSMSTMRAIDILPTIFIGILAGVFVDRFSRKKIMSFSTIVQIISLSIIIILIIINSIQVWHLYLLGFVLSSAGNIFWICQNSILPQIVNRDQLTNANAKITFSNTLLNTIGPGIAGLIIGVYSYQVSFTVFLICLLFLFILIQLQKIPNVLVQKSKRGSVWSEMKEGIIALFNNKILLTPTLVILVKNIANSLIIGVLVFYAIDDLKASKEEVGYIYSLGGLGGIVGSLLILKFIKQFGRGKVFVYSILIDLIGMICLIFSDTWWLVGISFFIRLFGGTMSNIVYITIRQEFTPQHLLGRISGTSSMMMKITFPIGLFLSGLWVEFLSIKGLFIVSTFLLLILFILIRKHPFACVE